jgi:hypothetical protein
VAAHGILLQLEIHKDSSILLGLKVHKSYQSGPPVRPVWPLPDRQQDAPPVRRLRDIGLTGGVSLIGLVPNLGANICPSVFLFLIANDLNPYLLFF